jgi:hypothetical protein
MQLAQHPCGCITLMPAGITSQRSVQVPAFDDIGRRTLLRRIDSLRARQTSALPSTPFRFALDCNTLAVWQGVALVGSAESFRRNVGAPCQAHQRKRRALARLFAFESGSELVVRLQVVAAANGVCVPRVGTDLVTTVGLD